MGSSASKSTCESKCLNGGNSVINLLQEAISRADYSFPRVLTEIIWAYYPLGTTGTKILYLPSNFDVDNRVGCYDLVGRTHFGFLPSLPRKLHVSKVYYFGCNRDDILCIMEGRESGYLSGYQRIGLIYVSRLGKWMDIPKFPQWSEHSTCDLLVKHDKLYYTYPDSSSENDRHYSLDLLDWSSSSKKIWKPTSDYRCISDSNGQFQKYRYSTRCNLHYNNKGTCDANKVITVGKDNLSIHARIEAIDSTSQNKFSLTVYGLGDKFRLVTVDPSRIEFSVSPLIFISVEARRVYVIGFDKFYYFQVNADTHTTRDPIDMTDAANNYEDLDDQEEIPAYLYLDQSLREICRHSTKLGEWIEMPRPTANHYVRVLPYSNSIVLIGSGLCQYWNAELSTWENIEIDCIGGNAVIY